MHIAVADVLHVHTIVAHMTFLPLFNAAQPPVVVQYSVTHVCKLQYSVVDDVRNGIILFALLLLSEQILLLKNTLYHHLYTHYVYQYTGSIFVYQ